LRDSYKEGVVPALKKLVLALLVVVMMRCAASTSVQAATITVTGNGSTSEVDNNVTLLEAIDSATNDDDANSDVTAHRTGTYGDDTIVFDATFFATAKTITAPSGNGFIIADTDNLTTITGPSAKLTLTGADSDSVILLIGTNASAAISGVTITNAADGVINFGTTTLTNCTASSNLFGFVSFGGTMNLTTCVASANSYGVDVIGGKATVTSSSLSNNSIAGLYLWSTANADATNSNLSGNGYYGIYNPGVATLANCTLSGNGGGILNFDVGKTTVINCTVSDNTYGVSNFNGTVTLKNSLVVGSGTNISGSATDGGGNRLTGTSAQAGLDPDGLKDNGGPTKTIALMPGSPAINAGDDANAAGLFYDQRGEGYSRIKQGHVDIGAFESDLLPGNPPTVSDISKTFQENYPTAFSATSFDAGFTDVDQGDTLQKVKILSLPSNGVLHWIMSMSRRIRRSRAPI
jgi:parallel beta-helix repeat protein